MGGNLFSINSAGEQEFIANILKIKGVEEDLWIGSL